MTPPVSFLLDHITTHRWLPPSTLLWLSTRSLLFVFSIVLPRYISQAYHIMISEGLCVWYPQPMVSSSHSWYSADVSRHWIICHHWYSSQHRLDWMIRNQNIRRYCWKMCSKCHSLYSDIKADYPTLYPLRHDPSMLHYVSMPLSTVWWCVLGYGTSS